MSRKNPPQDEISVRVEMINVNASRIPSDENSTSRICRGQKSKAIEGRPEAMQHSVTVNDFHLSFLQTNYIHFHGGNERPNFISLRWVV